MSFTLIPVHSCAGNHRVLGDNEECHCSLPPPPVICSPAAVHYACYRWLWFQPIITLLLNNLKWGGGKSQRCQGRRKMDASVLSDPHRELEPRPTWILPQCTCYFLWRICGFVGMSAALCMCFLFPAVRQQICIPILGRFVFVFVRTRKSVDQKRLKDLWLCVSHKTTRTQTEWRSDKVGAPMCLQVQTTNRSKYLSSMTVMVSTSQQNVTADFKCSKQWRH